jgi:hypothetical protein
MIDRSLVDRITIGREMSVSLRFFGLEVATGLVLGFAVAGDWISWRATLRDFALWSAPVVLLLVAAGFVEGRMCHASSIATKANTGSKAVAVTYIAIALVYVVAAGLRA